MPTSIGERAGAALAFIPIVSTVVGIIKMVNYSRREKEHSGVADTAHKTQTVAQSSLKNNDIAKCERQLFYVSAVELIPGVNIFAACVELWLLSKLSKERNTITETDLKDMGEESFWKLTKEKSNEALIIQMDNNISVTYEKGFLKLLLESESGEKPPLAELTDMYTLQFKDGNLAIPKAKLRLCGEYFETAFRSDMKETKEKVFKFEDISLKGFNNILRAIRMEEYDFTDYPDEFKIAANYLCFTVSIELPEGIYGQEDWERYWGNIGEVPPPPKKLVLALNGPCPILNKEKKADGPKMRDTHMVFWRAPKVDGVNLDVNTIEKIATSEKFGENKLGYPYCYDPIRTDKQVNKPIDKGYWFVMPKMPNTLIEKTRSMIYDQQKKFLKENFPGYRFPKTSEALLYNMMPRARTGAFVLGRGDPWTLTRCEEVINGCHVAVGGAALPGLILDINRYGANRRLCVVPVREF